MTSSTNTSKSSLSPKQIRLVELMQRINFGRIENLPIRDGEPVFESGMRIVRDIKFGAADNGPRPEVNSADFVLKTQVTDLFSQFDKLGHSFIECLDVKHGLPFRMSFLESTEA